MRIVVLFMISMSCLSCFSATQTGWRIAPPAVISLVFSNYQDFASCSNGALAGVTEITASSKGFGTWTRTGGGAFHSFKISSNAPFTYAFPVVVAGVTYTNTGTKWLRVDRGNITNEILNFAIPNAQVGQTGGRFQYQQVHFVIRPANTNDSINGRNFDHVYLQDNPQIILQNQTGSGAYNFLAHAPNGSNGGWIPYTPGQAYEIFISRNATTGSGVLQVYNEAHELIGTSTGTMPVEDWFNNYLASFNANYLPIDQTVTGYVEIGGFSATWQ